MHQPKIETFRWLTAAWLDLVIHDGWRGDESAPQHIADAMADNVNDEGMRRFFHGSPLSRVPKKTFYRWADQWAAAAEALLVVAGLTIDSDSGWGGSMHRNLEDFARMIHRGGARGLRNLVDDGYFTGESAEQISKATRLDVLTLLKIVSSDRHLSRGMAALARR